MTTATVTTTDFVDFVHYQNLNADIPQDILVSLPLRLEEGDLLAKPRRGKVPTRPPNNFLIFRTAYTRVLQSRGHWDLRMREVTSHAARAWKRASKEVRDECKKLAAVAKKKHEEVYGPPPKQTRRRRQNNVNTTTNKRSSRTTTTTRRTHSSENILIPPPAPVSPLVFPNSYTSPFYFEELILPDWQTNIAYFSPPESELGDAQQNYSIYPM